ncbi:MAG: phage terminase large subunit, partial [Gammaproteobacteria bacterium]|nr:phage terminase large subunit [Gammaproteobacteria bacterium]
VLCLELEKEAYRVARGLPREYDLIINVPPGTTKTITCSIMFPAWCWTKWFWMRFITASYSAALSLESAEYSRNLIMSDAFKEVYPELEIKEDKSAKGNFKVVKKEFIYAGRMPRMVLGGNRFSTSVGATVTGFHGHINIWDDPINPEQAVSEKELETANRWLDQTLSMRKCDKKVTAMIGIMQRLHQYDPTGHTLAKKGKKVRHICLPGEIRNYREQLNPPELAEYYQDDLLDPVRLSWKVLQDAEMDLGQYGYAGQIGQNPTPPGGGMFKVKNFIIADTLPSKVNFIMTIRYWDKAGTEGGGAYTVGVKMSQLTNDRWVVHDVVRGQWSSEVREEVITTTAVADGPNVLQYVEQEGGSGGKESAEATIVRLSRVGIACRVDHPTGSKELRADTYSVQVNRGRVILHKGEWNTAYIEELRYFPFGTYKDQVDASSGAYNMLTGKRVARRIV